MPKSTYLFKRLSPFSLRSTCARRSESLYTSLSSNSRSIVRMDELTWVSRWMPLWIRLEPWTRYKAYTPLERGNINGLNDSWLKQDDTLVLSEIQGRVASCARHHRKRSAGWDLPRPYVSMRWLRNASVAEPELFQGGTRRLQWLPTFAFHGCDGCS